MACIPPTSGLYSGLYTGSIKTCILIRRTYICLIPIEFKPLNAAVDEEADDETVDMRYDRSDLTLLGVYIQIVGT